MKCNIVCVILKPAVDVYHSQRWHWPYHSQLDMA